MLLFSGFLGRTLEEAEFPPKHVEAGAPLRADSSEVVVPVHTASPACVLHALKSFLVGDLASGFPGLERRPAHIALNGLFSHVAMATQRHASHFALATFQPSYASCVRQADHCVGKRKARHMDGFPQLAHHHVPAASP